MKKVFLIILFLFTNIAFFSFSYGLSTLPKYAYLRYDDNQKEVVILQQILNSDPETKIAENGAGSPGHETWYFGKLTEDALKKFQEKYGLETTGQINAKTWEKLNAYVIQKNNPKTTTTTTKTTSTKTEQATEEKNIYLDNKDTSTNSQEQIKSSLPATDYSPNSSTLLNDSFLNNILGKYSNLLSPSSYFNSPTTQPQTYSPYYQTSPAPQYFQQAPYQPAYTQPQANPYLGQYFSSQPTSGLSENNIYSKYFSNASPLQEYMQKIKTPTTSGDEINSGKISGKRGDIGQCQATMFAHATLAQGCKADSGDQQNNQRSASGVILSRTGVPAIPAVALPSGGSMGDAVEVKIIKTGQCKAFPLLDRGPAPRIVAAGKCIDLTGSAIDILKGRSPCKTVAGIGGGTDDGDQVQYAIIPGEKIKPGEVKDCKNLSN